MKGLNALRAVLAGLLLLAGLGAGAASAQVAVEDIGFVALPGDRFQIELEFSATPPQPEIFLIENPARLSMDFGGVTNSLAERQYDLEFDSADSVVVLEAQGRTRMVVNLNRPAPYSTRVQGNSLFVVIGEDGGAGAGALLGAAAQAAPAAAQAPAVGGDIDGIDFRRGENGAGEVVIDLGSNVTGSVNRVGGSLRLRFSDAELDAALQQRLDVGDFATPVQFVNVYEENGDVMIVAEVEGDYDYIAYHSGGEYILSVSPLAAAGAQAAGGEFLYTGERISLDFQDINVRAVLQILADFNDFSLVTSDSVSGNITLRLQDVPWDQALALVLRARGLDDRLVGNVLYVAPAEEIAQAELRELENQQQTATLAPLVTEYIPINYAVASDLLTLLSGASAAGEGGGGGGILSARGRATVDQRTNTLIVQDVEANLAQVRDMIERLDVPVRQVLIEARIVNASTNFSKALGVRWGGAYSPPDTGDQFLLSGSLASNTALSNNITSYNQAIAQAVQGGASLQEALATTAQPVVNINDALVVDLGVESATSSFALGFLGNDGLLQLELSALEASGNGEVIAQPKVATQDKQIARIESGVQIPYQSQAGGTAGGSVTQFIPAVLSLEVTPQITPDNRIIMQLDIHQDSVVSGSGAVPAISTNAVNTRVLVNDGQTVVLGGVFREELLTTVAKTPVLGDIPYLGSLFKRTENTETKTELLIFITPSIIEELR